MPTEHSPGRARPARDGVLGVHAESWWLKVWARFWMLPLAIVTTSLIAGLWLPTLDELLAEHVPYLFSGGPDGARAMLATIASAMISVTGLVFSITMIVLQLASSQFTPRVIGNFLQNRITQVTLGVFIASFVFALTVLRSVRGASYGGDAFVPQLSVSLSFVLVLVSMALFIAFIHQITTSIQVAKVISGIGGSTATLIENLYPPSGSHTPPAKTWSPRPGHSSREVLAADQNGNIVQIDFKRLISHASERDVVVVLTVAVGEFLIRGQQVATVWADGGEEGEYVDLLWIAGCVAVGPERTMRQEAAFGMRQLVDIAVRALSPGVNDPTTATQALDQIHRLLRTLVQRPSPTRYLADHDSLVRVVYRPQSVEELLILGVEEIAQYGAQSTQIQRRLRELIDDLAQVSLPQHRSAVDHLTNLLDDRRTAADSLP